MHPEMSWDATINANFPRNAEAVLDLAEGVFSLSKAIEPTQMFRYRKR